MLKTDTVLIILSRSLLLLKFMVEVNAAAVTADLEGLVYLNDYYIIDGAESWHQDRGQAELDRLLHRPNLRLICIIYIAIEVLLFKLFFLLDCRCLMKLRSLIVVAHLVF